MKMQTFLRKMSELDGTRRAGYKLYITLGKPWYLQTTRQDIVSVELEGKHYKSIGKRVEDMLDEVWWRIKHRADNPGKAPAGRPLQL